MEEKVRVETNDPNRPVVMLTVAGLVEKLAEIRPDRVRLMGPPNQPLSARIEIIPRKKFPFTVLDVAAKEGKFIKYKLVETCGDGNGRCVIQVENTKTEKGRYMDVLYVKTDSPVRSRLPIYITGLIR